MASFSKEVLELVRRLQNARLSLMKKQPFYAVLLLHMRFAVDEICETAYTDGNVIAFQSDFISKLSDTELEFVLMHEVLHVALDHPKRTLKDYDYDLFNVACDVVVNSNILYSTGMDAKAINLDEYGIGIHKTPDGREGYLFSAEEVYAQLTPKNVSQVFELAAKETKEQSGKGEDESASPKSGESFDDHSFWDGDDDGSGDGDDDEGQGNGDCNADGGIEGEGNGRGSDFSPGGDNSSNDVDVSTKDIWLQRMIEATEIAEAVSRNNGGKGCGNAPLCAERIIRELTECKTDWRTILDNFVQEDICDYSFNPPDRRFQDSIFLLPDYNEKDESVKDILFMIDASGSMSDEQVTDAYSEIKGAIDQFNGKLAGWLGFFDAEVVEPKPFEDEDEFKRIYPKGGGGTNFDCIFEYIRTHKDDEFDPVSIIIMTDGYAKFPDEKASMGIPVLWMINNKNVDPPWGRVARI